jgi:hypothetical protein
VLAGFGIGQHAYEYGGPTAGVHPPVEPALEDPVALLDDDVVLAPLEDALVVVEPLVVAVEPVTGDPPWPALPDDVPPVPVPVPVPWVPLPHPINRAAPTMLDTVLTRTNIAASSSFCAALGARATRMSM